MERRCTRCKELNPIYCTPEQYALWQGGMLIPDAMPDVTPDQRELLISGICGRCFDLLFRDDYDLLKKD